MGPHRPPAQWGWATRAPQHFLHVVFDRDTGLQWGPSASGQQPAPHPLCETSLGWAGMAKGNAELGVQGSQRCGVTQRGEMSPGLCQVTS